MSLILILDTEKYNKFNNKMSVEFVLVLGTLTSVCLQHGLDSDVLVIEDASLADNRLVLDMASGGDEHILDEAAIVADARPRAHKSGVHVAAAANARVGQHDRVGQLDVVADDAAGGHVAVEQLALVANGAVGADAHVALELEVVAEARRALVHVDVDLVRVARVLHVLLQVVQTAARGGVESEREAAALKHAHRLVVVRVQVGDEREVSAVAALEHVDVDRVAGDLLVHEHAAYEVAHRVEVEIVSEYVQHVRTAYVDVRLEQIVALLDGAQVADLLDGAALDATRRVECRLLAATRLLLLLVYY